MASRLYPGFGGASRSKKKQIYTGTFEVRAIDQCNREDLECGDKVILPQSTFKEIKRLGIPFPLVFEVENARRRNAITPHNGPQLNKKPTPGMGMQSSSRKPLNSTARSSMSSKSAKSSATVAKTVPTKKHQYCGVMEFSAAEGKCFMPKWMMNNLKIRSGGQAVLTTTQELSKGSLVRFQPHKTAFIDLAANFGPRELMEHAMKKYSALSNKETILVECAGELHYLDVLEVQPDGAALLYGDLDLEVDFAIPKDQEKNEEEKKEYFDCEGESKYESKRSARPSSARRLREAVAAARGGDQSQAKSKEQKTAEETQRAPTVGELAENPELLQQELSNLGLVQTTEWKGVDLGGIASPPRQRNSGPSTETTSSKTLTFSSTGYKLLSPTKTGDPEKQVPAPQTDMLAETSESFQSEFLALRAQAAERWRKRKTSESPPKSPDKESPSDKPATNSSSGVLSPPRHRQGWFSEAAEKRAAQEKNPSETSKIENKENVRQLHIPQGVFSGSGKSLWGTENSQSAVRSFFNVAGHGAVIGKNKDNDKIETTQEEATGLRLGGTEPRPMSPGARYRSRLVQQNDKSNSNVPVGHSSKSRSSSSPKKSFLGGSGILGRPEGSDVSNSKYEEEKD